MSDESKELNRQTHIGKICTETTKKRMSEKRKGKYIGKDSPCWGMQASNKTKLKMSESHKCFYSDENNKKITIR